MIELWARVHGIARLFAVVQVVGEKMATDAQAQEFWLKAGDSQTIRWTVQDDASPPAKWPVDPLLDRFKFSIKQETTLLEDVLLRTSYRAGDIDLSGSADSHVAVAVLPDDLRGAGPWECRWELEMFREGAVAPASGTVDAAAGGTVLSGTGTAFLSEVSTGDVVELAGTWRTIVRRVDGDGRLVVDPGDWPDLAGASIGVAQRTACRTVAAGFVRIRSEVAI